MKKIYLVQSSDGSLLFQDFINKLDKKMRKKVDYGLKCMAMFPDFMTEPHVKHFSIERNNKLYEYRERIKIMVRITFAFDKNGDIILLYPFIKKHDRNTMQALEMSVKILEEIENGSSNLVEFKGDEQK